MIRTAVLLAAVVLIAGCGGSSSSSSSASSNSAPPASASTTTAASSTASPPTRTSGTVTGSVGPSGGAAPTPGTRSTPARGSANVRVPATFSITSSGKLEPATVSSPAFLAVQLSVASLDAKAHTLVLKTPTPHTITVPAHGRASVLVPGLRAGQYQIDLDGKAAAALLVGGEPGP